MRYKDQQAELELVVVKGDGPSLLGRDWLRVIRLNWANLNNVRTDQRRYRMCLGKHDRLFQDELGLVTVPPKFCKPRTGVVREGGRRTPMAPGRRNH